LFGRDSRGDTGLISGYLRKHMSQDSNTVFNLAWVVQTVSALQQFHLRRAFDQDGVAREPPIIGGIELITNQNN